MSIVLLSIYYEFLPIFLLVKKKTHILKKIAILLIYNFLLLKSIVPPSIYKLEELGLSSICIKLFYLLCNTFKFSAPILLAVILNWSSILKLKIALSKKNLNK